MANMNMEWYSTSLIRKMQITTTMRYHLTLVRTASSKSLQIINAGEGVEKKESGYSEGGNENWCSHCIKQCGASLKTLKIEPPHYPATPLLRRQRLIWKDACTLTFLEALFTIDKTWRQPKKPLTGNWLKTEWCMCIQQNATQPWKHKAFTATGTEL